MKVDIPDPVGYALMERAIRLNVPVHVVAAAAMGLGSSEHQRVAVPMHAAIGRMVDSGLCDADIAAATGYVVGWVAQVRRGLGKPANRRYRRMGNPSL
jgi:hypothetical protein